MLHRPQLWKRFVWFSQCSPTRSPFSWLLLSPLVALVSLFFCANFREFVAFTNLFFARRYSSLSRLAVFSNFLALLMITFTDMLVHSMVTAPRLKKQRRCESPLSASSTQSPVFRPVKRRKIDCVDYGVGLYSPPSQASAVINQSQFSPTVRSGAYASSATIDPYQQQLRSAAILVALSVGNYAFDFSNHDATHLLVCEMVAVAPITKGETRTPHKEANAMEKFLEAAAWGSLCRLSEYSYQQPRFRCCRLESLIRQVVARPSQPFWWWLLLGHSMAQLSRLQSIFSRVC